MRDTSLQRLSLWLMAASLAVVLALYGLPAIVHRVTLAVERARSEAAGIQLKRLGETSDVFRLVSRRVAPAVVNVSNLAVVRRVTPRFGPSGRLEFDQEYGLWPRGQGSGFVIDSRGYIVTNRHVVEDAGQVQVKFAHGTELLAKIVAIDRATDLAVLKVDSDGLLAAEFGDSDEVEVGDWVLAIGNPFGLEQSVTAGIISAKGRSGIVEQVGAVEDFLQTDAAINPGNSGGPLVDLHGRVIGINTAIFTRSGGYQGIGFAIPSNIAVSVAERIISEGRVTRGWLGITGETMATASDKPPGAAASGGVIVREVFPASPAAKAGLRSDDVIVSIAGRRISTMQELRTRIATAKIGTALALEIDRAGQTQKIEATITEQASALLKLEERFGVRVQDLTPTQAEQIGLPWDRGVWIAQVDTGSAGYRSGLRRGQRVIQVGQRPVETVEEFAQALEQLSDADVVVLGIETPQGLRRLVGLEP
jgi:serine protease Do